MSQLNKNSNGYIFGFALLIILVCGVLLSVVSGALAERQKMEVELERKKFILRASIPGEIEGLDKQAIAQLYEERVEEKVLDASGKELEGVSVNNVVIGKEYKKLNKQGELMEGAEMRLPVYLIKESSESDKIGSYVLPMYGFGLWDNIWGYMALEQDMNTIRGVVLDHKGETPGLGARITEDEVQSRFEDKKIFNESGDLVSVSMQKGEGNDYGGYPHKVDGLSGSTLTANGVNKMFSSYLNLYQPYINQVKK